MFKNICIYAAILALSISTSTVGQAQEAQSVQALISAGMYDEARTQLIDKDASNLEKSYFEGIILHHQKKYKEAVALFRRILDARPEQILVRQALYKSLLAMKHYEAAEYQLGQLLEQDDNVRNRVQYKAAQRRIATEKPYGFSGSFAIVPSSNINRGTTNDVFSTGLGDFVIDEGGKETPGISISASVSGYWRFQLDGGNTVTMNGSVAGSKSVDSDSASYSYKIWADYRNPTERGYWQVSPKYTLSYISGERSHSTTGLDFKLKQKTSPENIWTYTLGGYYSDFYETDYRNGVYWNGSVSLRRKLSPTLSVTGKLGTGAGMPDSEHLQYHLYSASVNVTKSWASGWRTSVGAAVDYKPFVGNFTAVEYPREDWGRTLRMSVMNTNFTIGGASPRLGCSFKDVESNVAFYDYTVQECSISFTRRF